MEQIRWAPAPSRSLFSLFIDQFKDFMIITLLLAAAISFAAAFFTKQGDYIDPFIILAILIMNACFGVYQELRAHQALKSLDTLQTPHCLVLREGKRQSVLSSLLVPGDLVCLSLGDLIPADGRILQCEKLAANESALTGESDPVIKQTHVLSRENLPLGDPDNMVYAGTLITAGHGLFCVTETGMNTQVGKIAHVLSQESAPDTPLTRHLNRMGVTLGLIALGICVLLFFLGSTQRLRCSQHVPHRRKPWCSRYSGEPSGLSHHYAFSGRWKRWQNEMPLPAPAGGRNIRQCHLDLFG